MLDFILLMHNDSITDPTPGQWDSYFAFLRERDAFEGGSSIGPGGTFRKQGVPGDTSTHLAGYIRVRAADLAAARALLAGNPVFDCGGTVEIRELPRG